MSHFILFEREKETESLRGRQTEVITVLNNRQKDQNIKNKPSPFGGVPNMLLWQFAVSRYCQLIFLMKQKKLYKNIHLFTQAFQIGLNNIQGVSLKWFADNFLYSFSLPGQQWALALVVRKWLANAIGVDCTHHLIYKERFQEKKKKIRLRPRKSKFWDLVFFFYKFPHLQLIKRPWEGRRI